MRNLQFEPGKIPPKPGIYIFRDSFGEVIYVGKASNLRKRMSHYFQPSKKKTPDPKLRSLINSISAWEFQVVRTDAESLLLESRLIKEYSPRYNVLLRDDKRFFLLKINYAEKFPKLSLARVRKNDGAAYFGPFPQSGALKQTIEFLSRFYKLRLCRPSEPDTKDRKHCMEARVKQCCEPCVGKITEGEYREKVENLKSLFRGDTKFIVEKLKEEMKKLAASMQFEKAALRRDIIQNIIEIFGAKNRSFRFSYIPSPTGSNSVDDLQKQLGLKKRPAVIEAYDISNFGSLIAVASMVCFNEGKPSKKNYRRFKIKTVDGINDFAMMNEVIGRRFTGTTSKVRKAPDLILVDGGKGQLSSAIKALIDTNIEPFPVLGLAKKHEEIYLPGKSDPLILTEQSAALRLLQAIRDEAHRFAISYTRLLRDKRLNESILDDINGIGEERKKAILREFSSIAELRKCTPEEISFRVKYIGLELARKISLFLN